jgi:hypothetical protein
MAATETAAEAPLSPQDAFNVMTTMLEKPTTAPGKGKGVKVADAVVRPRLFEP